MISTTHGNNLNKEYNKRIKNIEKGEKVMTDLEFLAGSQFGKELLKEHKAIVKKEAKKEAIKVLIESLFSFGISREDVIHTLRTKYRLSKKNAIDSINEYLPA